MGQSSHLNQLALSALLVLLSPSSLLSLLVQSDPSGQSSQSRRLILSVRSDLSNRLFRLSQSGLSGPSILLIPSGQLGPSDLPPGLWLLFGPSGLSDQSGHQRPMSLWVLPVQLGQPGRLKGLSGPLSRLRRLVLSGPSGRLIQSRQSGQLILSGPLDPLARSGLSGLPRP